MQTPKLLIILGLVSFVDSFNTLSSFLKHIANPRVPSSSRLLFGSKKLVGWNLGPNIVNRRTKLHLYNRITPTMLSKTSSSSDASTVLQSIGFGADQISKLLSVSDTGTAADGEVLLKEGSDILAPLDDSRVYLILSGQVTITKGNKFFSSLSVGDFIGERRFLELEVLDSLGKLRSNPIEEIFAIVDADNSGAVSPGIAHKSQKTTPTSARPRPLFTTSRL